MHARPEQRPEGKLIADALTRMGLSIREASRRAGLSYGRWRQITSGFQNVSPGVRAPVKAPPATLARMCAVVRITPEQLTGTDPTSDRIVTAAAILADLIASPPQPDDTPGFVDMSDESESHIWRTPGLSAPERQALVATLRAVRSVPGASAFEQEFLGGKYSAR